MADELVERLLTDIADMMSQHVENWPYPRKIDTAITLISKTLDAALTDTVPRDVAESWKAKAENLSAARKEGTRRWKMKRQWLGCGTNWPMWSKVLKPLEGPKSN